MTDMSRILTFAGQPVPEEGLTVSLPQGGELTVWPDGGYAFTPSADDAFSDGQEPLTTYYSYDIEDIDGTVSSGAFVLNFNEVAPEETMPDFQAWSMDDILALEDAVGLVVDLPGAVAELSGVSAGGEAVLDSGLEMECGSFDSDVLEHVIKTSYES